jgi:hypothetical protein
MRKGLLIGLLAMLPGLAICGLVKPDITAISATANSVSLSFSERSNIHGWWRVHYGVSSGNLNNSYDNSPARDNSSATIGGLKTQTVYYFSVTFYVSGTNQNSTSAVKSIRTASPTPTPTPTLNYRTRPNRRIAYARYPLARASLDEANASYV